MTAAVVSLLKNQNFSYFSSDNHGLLSGEARLSALGFSSGLLLLLLLFVIPELRFLGGILLKVSVFLTRNANKYKLVVVVSYQRNS